MVANHTSYFAKMENTDVAFTNEQKKLLNCTTLFEMPFNDAKELFDALCEFIDSEIKCFTEKINICIAIKNNGNATDITKQSCVEYFQEQIEINVQFKITLIKKFYDKTQTSCK